MLHAIDWGGAGGFFTSVLVLTTLAGTAYRLVRRWASKAREKVRKEILEEQEDERERVQLADLQSRLAALEKLIPPSAH